MNDTPRTAPCPCGSGKKHKNCCLKLDVRELAKRSEHRTMMTRVVEWLRVRHGVTMRRAIDRELMSMLDEERRSRLAELPAELVITLHSHAVEWWIVEGEVETSHGQSRDSRTTREVLLGIGGPLLTVPQRLFLEELVRTPLRLYEVQASHPGEGLLLSDMLEPSSDPIWVVERKGSEQLVQWDVFAARAVRVSDHLELSGSVFTFPHREARKVLAALRETSDMATARRTQPDARVVSRTIFHHWLDLITAPVVLPIPTDQGTGDPLMLVTDHYEVLDWNRLAEILAAQADVEGNRQEGWTRFVELEGGRRRSLLAINIGEAADRVEPFARTLDLAEQGKAWLQSVAGDSIRFLIRDIVDPMTILNQRRSNPERRERPAPAMAQISPAEQTRMQQNFLVDHYRNWAIESIPALGDKTPRDACKTQAGREEVIALLKDYEAHEFRRARKESREPVDLGFLWGQAGLDRASLLVTR